MRLGYAALLTALLLLATACQQRSSGGNGQAPPRQVGKIISLSPSSTEIIGELQLTPILVGRTINCDSPKEAMQAVVVVSGTKPDFEKIARIRPDLVVYDSKLYMNTDMDALKQSDPIILKMDVNSIEDLMDVILKLGSVTGTVTAASEEADKLYSARERAKGAAPATKVRVAILSGGTGDYLAAGTESFLADVVKSCGGELIGPPGKVFAPLAPEKLLSGNPEIILVAGKAGPVLSDTRLASVDAVKSRPQAVYEVPENVLYRPGPRSVSLIDDLSNKISTFGNSKGH